MMTLTRIGKKWNRNKKEKRRRMKKKRKN